MSPSPKIHFHYTLSLFHNATTLAARVTYVGINNPPRRSCPISRTRGGSKSLGSAARGLLQQRLQLR